MRSLIILNGKLEYECEGRLPYDKMIHYLSRYRLTDVSYSDENGTDDYSYTLNGELYHV